MIRNPRSKAEWQEAVDLAAVYLLVHSARLYGMIQGGPEINTDRCEEILRIGREKQIIPSRNALDRTLPALTAVHKIKSPKGAET